ncbi:MAG TPA: glycosyltransferase family 39 protein [Gammaproteobacteria bacterium]|nr:glycosyltransferase family 39 protein [Gammaproteobacteria bacterium]
MKLVGWGEQARLRYLLIAAAALLFCCLGSREIWTQEHRWADIVFGMFYRNDFLHPYLGQATYYDKPLLSYWLIAAVAKISGALTTWSLRLPSVLAGMLAITSIYSLGKSTQNRSVGLLAGWLLLTTFYFVFWARTSSADMLNLGGSLCAIAWYYAKREQPTYFNYTVFFLIIALTALCKGLVGVIVPIIGVLVDIVLAKSWRRHLRPALFLSILPALVIYILPFLASSYIGGETYTGNGLYLVYKENILRYFHPFDHEGPLYTYFIYLPVYLMPWFVFFVPALFTLRSRFRTMAYGPRWVAWTLLCVFLFFTASGSRRSYYVLPVVPFAILFIASWLYDSREKYQKLAGTVVILSFTLLFLVIDLVPAWYFSQVGAVPFAAALKKEAVRIRPWDQWQVVMLDAESKLSFYLQLPPQTKNFDIKGDRNVQTAAQLQEAWPILAHKPARTIFVTRQRYAPLLREYFRGYKEVAVRSRFSEGVDVPVAFVPNGSI